MGENKALIDNTLTQDMIDHLYLNADRQQGSPYDHLLDEVTHVEMHDGFIRFLGKRHLPDRSEVDASFELSLSAENDFLNTRIVVVDIPGVDLNDHRIVEANEELEYELTHMVHTHADVLFKEGLVQEGVLRMKVQVSIDHSRDPLIRMIIN